MQEIITAEEAVKRFLSEYHAWILAGAPTEGTVFTHNGGLCRNLSRWEARQRNILGYTSVVLQRLWLAEGLDYLLPFDGNTDAHFNDCEFGACHLNKARIEFVARHAK